MGRGIYSYELTDTDFAWLISNFRENNPDITSVESSTLPVVLIRSEKRIQPLLPATSEPYADEENEFNGSTKRDS